MLKQIKSLFFHLFVFSLAVCISQQSPTLRNIEQITTQHAFIPWQTFYMEQYVDHFNHRDNRTFNMRYLVNDPTFNSSYLSIQDQWFDPEHGAVFFYPGNEADIELFWNNTGFMFDIAPIFQPLIVFAEHRYYGQTHPFCEASFDLDKIVYLSIEQVMGDYALLLQQLKIDYNLSNSANPVIAFGGSYGGMLAAYMRYKYPNLVHGALASSAPIYILSSRLASNTNFFADVSNDFKNVNGCENVVRQAFQTMESLYKKGDYTTLSQKFQLCNPISDEAGYRHLLIWLRNAFTVMSMADYPYKASFLSNFPAWPVNASCAQIMNDTAHGVDILTAFKNFAGIVYNDSLTCYDIFAEFVENADPTSGSFLGDDAKAWDYQMCTELSAVFSSNGITDIFPEIDYTEQMRADYCRAKYNITDVRRDWSEAEFWADNLADTTSNIVFSNGLLDPLHSYSPLEDMSDTVKAVVIAEGAHHLDLRSGDPADPPSVRYARYLEIKEIISWIEQARSSKN